MEKRYFSVKEIAEYLSMSAVSIYRYTEERKMPFLKIGKTLRYDIKQVEKWLEGYRHEPLQ